MLSSFNDVIGYFFEDVFVRFIELPGAKKFRNDGGGAEITVVFKTTVIFRFLLPRSIA